MPFLLSFDFFLQNQPFKKFFIYKEYTTRVSNNLDPDQALHSVRPDLGPNSLQRLSTVDTSSLASK